MYIYIHIVYNHHKPLVDTNVYTNLANSGAPPVGDGVQRQLSGNVYWWFMIRLTNHEWTLKNICKGGYLRMEDPKMIQNGWVGGDPHDFGNLMSLSHFKKACQVLRCVSLASKRALDHDLVNQPIFRSVSEHQRESKSYCLQNIDPVPLSPSHVSVLRWPPVDVWLTNNG